MAYDKAEEKKEAKPSKSKDDREICRVALERYQRGIERDRENIDEAYEDLRFRAGDQWDDEAKRAREKRPMLTINRIPQFVRQVTGDMRQMRPGVKVVPVDSRGDKETAETIGGMIRYVENRSDANAAYMAAADSQVVCGIGHIQVTTEYAADTTFNQEIRILGVDDHVGVVWDPDAVLADKSDAKWCIVPTDMSREAFKENYPDCNPEDFEDSRLVGNGWITDDSVRVAIYWCKKPVKRKLALMPDGSVVDMTDGDAELTEKPKKIETRDGFKLCRYLITAAHVLEEREWPTSDIPVVPVIGEEVRIGRKIVRHGLIRFAKDPQRMYNYFRSAQTEVVALQPKAPFIGTEKNFEKYQQQWGEANSKAHAVLPYTPDPANGGSPPQRSQPPVSSQGISEGVALAVEDMKGVIGIYDAGLGNRSNETSGKAILARQREGDTSSYVYIDNWTRAIKRVGEIVSRLIPHIYDTERMIRIMGEDGKVDLKWINKPVGMQEIDENGELSEIERVHNDVTIGAYDIVMDTGPSYTTKRQEARESMMAFIQAAPQMTPVVMDLVAKAQDWPLADEIGKRLEAVAPPPVQKLIAKQKKESGDEEQPEPPSPGEQQQQQIQQAAIQLELENKHLANEKIKAEIGKIQGEAQGAPDPVSIVKAQAEQQRMALDARKAELEAASMQQELEIKRQIAAVELEIKLADLAIKRQGLQLDTAAAAMDLQSKQQGMVHEAERHTAGLVQGMEKHQSGMTMGAESHAAKVQQMSAGRETR